MLKTMFMAGSLLAAVVLSGCADFMEGKDPIDSNFAVVSRFEGKWKIEKQIFQSNKKISTQSGTAICEMIGKTARIYSPELKQEILFGIRLDGEYALIDVNAARDRMLVGKDTEEEEEDGDAKETNNDLDLKFGKGVLGEIKFQGNNTIEISYFKEHDGKEALLEKILLTRIQ